MYRIYSVIVIVVLLEDIYFHCFCNTFFLPYELRHVCYLKMNLKFIHVRYFYCDLKSKTKDKINNKMVQTKNQSERIFEC
jgi:hypothetical protein